MTYIAVLYTMLNPLQLFKKNFDGYGVGLYSNAAKAVNTIFEWRGVLSV